jgi:hypothetical protein
MYQVLTNCGRVYTFDSLASALDWARWEVRQDYLRVACVLRANKLVKSFYR